MRAIGLQRSAFGKGQSSQAYPQVLRGVAGLKFGLYAKRSCIVIQKLKMKLFKHFFRDIQRLPNHALNFFDE